MTARYCGVRSAEGIITVKGLRFKTLGASTAGTVMADAILIHAAGGGTAQAAIYFGAAPACGDAYYFQCVDFDILSNVPLIMQGGKTAATSKRVPEAVLGQEIFKLREDIGPWMRLVGCGIRSGQAAKYTS